MVNVYELVPQYDSANSFYGKAHVIVYDDMTTLQSYQTNVAYINAGVPHVNGTYSATTLRHIKEFLRQHGLRADSKAQIIRDYMGGEK